MVPLKRKEEKTDMASYKTLIVEEKNGIVRVTLNRPDQLNALTAEMYQELGKVIDEMETNPAFRALIITGAGRYFCAGGDIPELLQATTSIEAIQKRERLAHGVVASLRRIKQPVIMAINGGAIGAGCSLALNGDLRVTSEKARFGVTFIRVGLVPDMGSIYNLVHLVGISKACELAFLADVIDAREAERIGLVNRVVAHDELDAVAHEWAARLVRSPSLALSLTKTALYRALNMDFFSELEDEINIQSLCLNSHDGKEGLKAFLEKREPIFESVSQ